jgi:predicted nucleic acid-binding protein
LIVVLDCNALVAWSDPKETLNRSRLEHLFDQLSATGGKIIVPTPVLAEYLVKTNDATSGWLAAIERKRAFEVVNFDRKAAFECSLFDKAAIGAGDKRAGRTDAWQRIKIDRQIVAIAKVRGAAQVVSDDTGLCSTARGAGLTAVGLSELDLPPSAAQQKLEFTLGTPEQAATKRGADVPSTKPAADGPQF